MKPISSLEKAEEGIAEFEHVHNEYVLAGGTLPSNEERKTDLLAVMPGEIREALLWKANDPGPFHLFRDMIILKANQLLLHRRRLQVNSVNIDETVMMQDDPGDYDDFPDLTGLPENVVMAINQWRGR